MPLRETELIGRVEVPEPLRGIITIPGLIAPIAVPLPGAVPIEEGLVTQRDLVGVHIVPLHHDLLLIHALHHHRAVARVIGVQPGQVVREVRDIEVQAEARREVQDIEVLEVVPEVQAVSAVLVAHSDLQVVADQAVVDQVVAVPEEVEADNNSIIFILT